ncbi:MAG: hypothetical protein Q8R28_11190 [Dehalococcoidia bacterium]|nr:hypothetical protein [Dehalococcoidia bacterium]
MPKTLTTQDRIARAMSEDDLLWNVWELAEHLGFLFDHSWDSRANLWVAQRAGLKGLQWGGRLDIVLILDTVSPPRIIEAELKRELGSMTERQQRFLAALKAAGREAYLWRPSDWLDGTIERVLRQEHGLQQWGVAAPTEAGR